MTSAILIRTSRALAIAWALVLFLPLALGPASGHAQPSLFDRAPHDTRAILAASLPFTPGPSQEMVAPPCEDCGAKVWRASYAFYTAAVHAGAPAPDAGGRTACRRRANLARAPPQA